MNRTVELFLDGQKVEWPKVPDILLTYQRTDYLNPTVTKNSFSKTVTIDGTQVNNDIFNHIWQLDRIMDDNYILFNPSQRVPFELYNNGEIVEKGYAKLDSIKKEGYKIAYGITLYGGLGSFFYSLAYDINTDTEKTLADLNYTNTNTPDDEFTFEINKNRVWDAWSRIGKPNNTGSWKKWDFINFVPCYNGLPDDFDSDKVLINTHSATGLSVRYTNSDGVQYGTFPTSISNDGTAYTPYNGYVYGEMRRECNEWEMRDLRSYLQRPALSVKGLFTAICNPINNGGYNVVLDPQFFSSDNPYYDKAWITLPMLNSSSLADDTSEFWDWYDGEKYVEERPRTMYLKIVNYQPFNDTPDKLRINCEIHASFSAATANTLYTTCIYHSSGFEQDGAPVGDYEAVNSTAVQFYINKTNALGRENTDDIASSNRIVLSSKLPNGHFWDGGASWNDMPASNHTKQVSLGTWKKVAGSDYVWTTYNNETEFTIDLETNHINTIPMVGFITKSVCRHDTTKCGFAYDAQYYGSRAEMDSHSFSHQYMESPQNLNSEIVFRGGYKVRSYQTITKKNILGGLDGTPCDWLLSYCKLFGLFIEKDKVEDTIYIKLRNNWYNKEQVDLEKLIDRSQEINVTPLTFESKWYNFKYAESEGKFLDSYKEVYSQDFGVQQIDTKYNFDADSVDLLEDNNYTNGLVALEKSNYYNVKYDQKNFVVFPCLYDWCTVSYFKDGETYETYMALPAGTTTTYMNTNMNKEFYDFLPKLQFHTDDNSGTDGVGVLVFFNGIKNTGDIDYWVSDDVEEMFDQSDSPCWLQTHCEYNTSWDERIAIETHTLPEFNRYVLHNNIITATWDFGYTKELYVPYYRYEVNRTPTIYENFWKAYISDLYSVNTRNVECNVALDTNNVYDFMRKFYWFDNCYWVCTKVTDFDIAVDKSTKCSFTKVNDMSNYFDTPTFDDYFFNFYRTDGGGNVPAQGTDAERTVYFNLDSSSPWMVWEIVGYVNINGIYQGNYVVGQEINATFQPNYNPEPRVCGFVANNGEGQMIAVEVWQDGYVKEKKLTLNPNSVVLPKNVTSPVSVEVDSSANWFCTTGNWAIINPVNGTSGITNITVSATTNSGSERTLDVLFNNADGLSTTLNVKQKGFANVSLEQNEIFPKTTVPASGGNVFYKIINDIECTVEPMGNTANYAVASGQVTYSTMIQPQSGMNFWIHFSPNTGTVTRNAAFYANYVEDGGRYCVMPTIVPLPLVQEASGNTVVQYQSKEYTSATTLGASGMSWKATTPNSWITLITASGSSSATSVEYTVSQNTGGFRRGYIYVTYSDEMGYYCNETIVIEQEGEGGFVVNPTAITVDYKGGDFAISVTSDTNYNVSMSESWATQELSRDNTFMVHIAENDGYARTMNINVTSSGQTITIPVNQGSKYANQYTLDYAPSDIMFESSGGTISVTIRSDSDWTITDGYAIEINQEQNEI
jgi:hypothetical protein